MICVSRFSFRMDITTILLCMFDQMMYVCDSSSKLLEPGYHQQPYYDIHNMCSILLSTLAVLTSPIDLLYRWVWNTQLLTVYQAEYLKVDKR